jgi:hypothetical protein
MKKTAFVGLALVLLSCASWAQAWVNEINTAVGDQWSSGSWQALSMLALIIVFLIMSLAYMLSTIIGSREMKVWAKAEMFQVAASSAFVIGFLIVVNLLLVAATQISTNVAANAEPLPLGPEQKASPFALAHYYLDVQIDCAKTYYRRIFFLNLFLEPLEKAVITTGGMEEVTAWVLSGIVGTMHWIAHQLTFVLVADYFQRHLLVFIEDNALTVILPIGVVLRVLPYTRGAGGVLMAIALGLFFVYPMMYAVLLGMIPRTACAATAPSVYTWDAPGPILIALSMVLIEQTDLVSSIKRFINDVLVDIRILFVASIIYPLVNLGVTLSFIRASTQFLGADVAEMGQGLIKII